MCETRETCATSTGQTGSYWKQAVKSGSVGASYQESRALLRKQRGPDSIKETKFKRRKGKKQDRESSGTKTW